MKTSKDPRHLQRIKVMQEIFSWEFDDGQKVENPVTQEVLENLKKIDKLIAEAAPSWPIAKINRLDLAVLRLAAYELFIKQDVPVKVVVDEAVELAKEYGAASSASFVNGALGKMLSENPVSLS